MRICFEEINDRRHRPLKINIKCLQFDFSMQFSFKCLLSFNAVCFHARKQFLINESFFCFYFCVPFWGHTLRVNMFLLTSNEIRGIVDWLNLWMLRKRDDNNKDMEFNGCNWYVCYLESFLTKSKIFWQNESFLTTSELFD